MDHPPRTRPFNFENSEDNAPVGPKSYQHAQLDSGNLIPYSGTTSPNSEQNAAYQDKSQTSQDVIQETPRSLPLAPEEMGLIERPKMRKTFELDQEFEFGPPLQINPGQFTKQLKNPIPLYQSTQSPAVTSQPSSKDSKPRQLPFPLQEPGPGRPIEERTSNNVVSARDRLPPETTDHPSSVIFHEHEAQDTEQHPKRTVDTRPPPRGPPSVDASPPSAQRPSKVALPLSGPHISVARVKTSRHFTSDQEPGDSRSQTNHRASAVNASRPLQQHRNHAATVNAVDISSDRHQFSAFNETGIALDGEYHSEKRDGQSKDQSSPSSTTMRHNVRLSHTDTSHHQDIHMSDYSHSGYPETEDVVNVESRGAHVRSIDYPASRQPKSTSSHFESLHQEEPSNKSRQKSHTSHDVLNANTVGSGKPSKQGAGKAHSSSKPQAFSPIRRRAAASAARLHNQHTSRDPKTAYEQNSRPHLEGSNVSRRRAAVSTTARSDIIDITSTPGSEIIRSSPANNNMSVKISQEFTKDLAGVLNRFTTQHNSTRQELRERYHKYIKQLKKVIKKREHEAEEYIARVEGQASDIQNLEHSNGEKTQKIEELEHSKGEMAKKITEMEAVLEATAKRGSKAEGKYRKVKDHLNAAIEEQQKLYLMSKSQWEKAIREVRETERSHGSALEEMLQKTEIIRQQMLEKVRQTVGQCRQDTSKLYGQIDALTRQIEQKDAELSHEKKAVKMLSQQLETLKITNEGFEALRSRQNDIMGKMDEQNAQAIQRQVKADDAIGTRLGQIAEQVGSVSKTVSEQPQVLSTLQSQQQGILELLSGCIAEKEEALKNCQQEFKDMKKRFEDQQIHFSQLQAHAVELEVAHEDNQPLNQQLQRAQAEIERLEAEVSSRTAAISQLEKTIRSKEEVYVFEVKQFGSQVQQLNQLIMDKEATIQSASAKATELVRRELLVERDRETAELNKTISQLRSDRNTLDDLVTQLRQERASEEEAKRQNARTIELLKANLAISENQCSSLAKELKTRSDDLAESRHQRSTRISGLEADLAVWQKKAAELEANYTGLQETERRHTNEIESLKVTLAAAESKCSSLSEELEAKSLELEQFQQRGSSRIIDLEKELASWQKTAAELQATYSEVQQIEKTREEKMQECFATMEQLAVKEGFVASDAGSSKLFDSATTLDEVWSKIPKAVEQMMKMASTKYQAILDKQHQQLQALGGVADQKGAPASELQALFVNAWNKIGINPLQESKCGDPDGVSGTTTTPSNTEETSSPFLQHRVVMGLQDQDRRVAVRRPTSTEGIRKVRLPPPPSVAQEKSRRREAAPPKSIMKRMTRSASREQLIDNSSGSGAFGRIGPLETFTATPPENASASGRPNKRKQPDDIVDSPVVLRRGRYSKGAGGKGTTKDITSTAASAPLPNGSDERGSRGIVRPQRIYRSRHAVDKLSEGSKLSENGLISINFKPSFGLVPEVMNGANRFLPPRSAPTRTYGSRRSVDPTEDSSTVSQTNGESQSRSQSQPLSRYGGANDETQDSMTLSQNANKEDGDDLLLPPPGNKL
ncbi:hypothetical protein NEUTE1DRAFT_103967 [Neurospora tetrasperma FGSC 2508]|uniref:Uncharacterized protein n=1 Tax=Neurospora tetrasperma (strain FGSC 2508 / ATCC MYA-4615 / P0657) TaxID=510951 RepID=F8MXP8_NEUT8|nr:uncharacterized protein NEUTE1DRAFT_103967 [Neurospora tetrasperma FGSC 2508]EGO54519.1 hypothetical protein NEUTE1DRAFT_103967 [Neurospora tetrasperma FGSC 2508]